MSADYWRLCGALGVSRLGDVLSGMTLLLWIYSRSGHSAITVGFLVGAQFLSPMAAAPLISRIIDRLNRFRLMMAADMARIVLSTGLIICVIYSDIVIAIVIVGLMAGFGQMFTAAENAVIPVLVGEGHLGRANSYNNSISQAMFIIGPGVAAILYETVGPLYSLAFDSLSFVISATLLLGIARRSTGYMPQAPDSDEQDSQADRGRADRVISVILRTSSVRYVVIGLAVMAASAGISNTVGVVFLHVDLHINPAYISLLAGTNGVCQLAAAGVFPKLADRFRPERIVGVSLAVMAVGSWVYATSHLLAVTLVGVAVTALANAPFSVGMSVISQTAVPDPIRGRFRLVVSVIGSVMFFTGSQGSAWLAEYLNPRIAFMIAASLLVVAAATVLLPQLLGIRLAAERGT
jgi:DHA3 family macrolide efflux protein-like MFS transporter